MKKPVIEKPPNFDRRDRLAAAFLFVLPALVFWFTRTGSLTEWDSVNFVLGVDDFNLFRYQPHPPGYPLFIFWGWILTRLLPISAQTALLLAAALGGGLFSTSWFLIFRIRFTRTVSLVSALGTAFLPVIWLTSSMVLTDMAAAGFLALELLFASRFMTGRATRDGLLAAMAGAVAAGIRPQNIFIALLILFLMMEQTRRSFREWFLTTVLFMLFCLNWIVPTMWTQKHTPEGKESWSAYSTTMARLWNWKKDRPEVYAGAGKVNLSGVASNTLDRWLGWFTLGFGMGRLTPLVPVFLLFYLAGWIAYIRSKPWNNPRHRAFWKFHIPWSATHAVFIFLLLPPEQRYSCPLFPLLLFPCVSGLSTLGPFVRKILPVFPLLIFFHTLPLALVNHRVASPPEQMIRYLKDLYPEQERGRVWLYLDLTRRHATWLDSGFRILPTESPDPMPARIIEYARAVYTDDPRILGLPGQADLHLKLEKLFTRDKEIYLKHSRVELYRVTAGK